MAALQRALAGQGYDPGPIDGVWGRRTAAALQDLVAADGTPRASTIKSSAALPAPKAPLAAQTASVIRQGSAGTIVRNFMLHTAATPGDWWQGKTNAAMLAEIRRWHTTRVDQGGRGWRDIGYHYVIFPDGEWLPGRAETTVGAGAAGYNAGWLHACMINVKTIASMGTAAEFYTPATLATARRLIASAALRTPIVRLSGHNEVAAKLCPGFVVNDADWTDLDVE
jgi:peptidoglycan hydrolase-like protein with peptidoglycan-binding domain